MSARITSLLLAIAVAAVPALTRAASFNEGVNGDMSGDRLAPSTLSLDPGSNSLSGVTVAGDLDYITIAVPVGYVLSQLVLSTLETTDNLAFIAIQAGSQFTEPNVGADPANILGYAHIASAAGLGIDYLELMGQGIGAIGFTGPLPAGSYTLWIQQTGPEVTGYTFEPVVVAPEPAAFVLAALALAGLAAARARRVT